MFYEEEGALLRQCLTNMAIHADADPRAARVLCHWLQYNQNAVPFAIAPFVARCGDGDTETIEPTGADAMSALAAALRTVDGKDAGSPGAIETNLVTLADALGLTAGETALMRAVVWQNYQGRVASLFTALLTAKLLNPEEVLSVTLGLPLVEVLDGLGPRGLAGRGLLYSYDLDEGDEFRFYIPQSVRRAVHPPARTREEIEFALVGRPKPSALEWEDFDHEAPARDFIHDLLAQALKRKEAGINILLYGPPGAGKTELCRMLADRLGHALFAPGECDEDGHEPSRYERLTGLLMGQTLLAGRRDALLMFDEMEDLLPSGSPARGRRQGTGSKVFINRMLERNPVPVLWTSNDIEDFDPAMLRRMTFVHEMRTPSRPHRERQWTRMLRRHPACTADPAALARQFDFTPGLAAGAVRAASLADPDAARLPLAVAAIQRAMGGKPAAPVTEAGSDFDFALARTDTDIGYLMDRIGRTDGPVDFSLCCYGPPGTGKSMLARAAADRLGLDVLQMRASDMMSMWVGETEKRIAAAFEQAREERAFLVFDEADSFLADRAGASRTWEVSQVNEMLTWMESHPFPFACTTNLMERLDPASLRRFTFKIRFDYLEPSQIDAAFRRYFGQPAPGAVLRMHQLTPGDFAVVAKRLRFASETDAAGIAALLEAECAHKPGASARMGF